MQCNKSKAKCEIDDGSTEDVCRRCTRLGLPCQFAAQRTKGAPRQPVNPGAALLAQQQYAAAAAAAAAAQGGAFGPGAGGGVGFGQVPMVAYGNDGAMAARRLASALAAPGVDTSLDCEKGIMRALTEHGTGGSVPVELLREWTLIAVQRRDCGLLGRAMTLAAANGHSMETLLDSVGTLSTMLHEMTGLFRHAVIAAANPGGVATRAPLSGPSLSVASLGGEGDGPGRGLALTAAKLPEALRWVAEPTSSDGVAAQLALVKQVVNGRVTFFTNKAFEKYVISRNFLHSSWSSKGRPSTELFLHPADAPTVPLPPK